MMQWIRAGVVVAGLSVALPALGGELPLLIVASDFDAVIDGAPQPALRPAVPATSAQLPPATAKKPVAVATVAAQSAVPVRAPRTMK